MPLFMYACHLLDKTTPIVRSKIQHTLLLREKKSEKTFFHTHTQADTRQTRHTDKQTHTHDNIFCVYVRTHSTNCYYSIPGY
jgi:hypothetical protein